MGPRSADVGPLLGLPARTGAWRPGHLDFLPAPGDRGHRPIRPRDDRAFLRRLPALPAVWPATGRAGRGEARLMGRPSGPSGFPGRGFGAHLLARLHHAGGVLRLAWLGAWAGADRRRSVPAA